MTATTEATISNARTAETPVSNRADELIESFRLRHHIPGLSVAMVNDNGPLHMAGYGFADLANRTPATPATSYLWFSLTKVATATAAMRLAELGHLDLSAPISDFVDLGTKLKGAAPTVGQLVNHTAGFANPLPTRWVRAASAPAVDPGTFLRRQLQKHGKPKHRVGGRANYSNLGYLVLGEVIAQAANQPFPDYVTDAILRPAGMIQTGFAHPPGAVASTPYVRVPRPFGASLNLLFPREVLGRRTGSYLALEPFYVEGASYGGLVGTVADAGRFATMHLADGTIDGRQVLTPGAARRMRDINTKGARDFGQAWFRAADHRDLLPTYAEHLGAGGGFFNAMRIYPDLRLGIVTMANTTSSYPHHDLFDQLIRLDWS